MQPKSMSAIAATLVAVLLFAIPLRAQIGVGGHVGYDVDFEELYVGANAMITTPLEIGKAFARVNPEFSYYLVSDDDEGGADTSIWFAAVNLIYPFDLEVADFYGGVGAELTSVSVDSDFDLGEIDLPDLSDSSTKFGVNLKIGAQVSLLFGEFGYHIRSDIGGPYAQGGLRLMLGG